MQHNTSRLSLEASTSSLLAAAKDLDDMAVGVLAEDLRAVGSLLRREHGLRRSISEGSTAPDSRSAMITSLLAGKVGVPAVTIVAGAAGREWSSSADLSEAIFRLSRTADFLRAERNGTLDAVEDELFRFGRILDASPELSVALDAPTTSADDRISVITRLLDGKANSLTLALLKALAADTRGRSYSSGVAELIAQAAQRRDKVVAVVTSPVELSAEQRARVAAALQKVYQRSVAVHVAVDPQLQGGLSIRVGDDLIDGSVSGRLAQLRARLAG